jgi:farnesyl diphosphate synthase
MARNYATALRETAAAVEAVLGRLLATGAPERLAEAMRYAVLSGGKRLRPFLLVETAGIFGKAGDGPLRAAAALECLHSYSLVHDDLPAMDDDDLRRGKPTVHRAFDEATAILAGDALLTLAFEILSDPATDPDPAVRSELAARLAGAAGARGMVGGQALDMAGEGKALPRNEVARLQAMKTGALFRYAATAGGVLGHAQAEDLERLAEFGAAYGAAFQLADDLLDHQGDLVALGKSEAKDARRAKPTLVALLGEDGARQLLQEKVDEATRLLSPYGPRADNLRESARLIGRRTEVRPR